MKKIILNAGIIAVSILTAINANAQKGFYLGIEGTPQLSWMANKDDMNNSNFSYMSTAKGSFGIASEYISNKTAGIGLSVLYAYQGQHFKLSDVEMRKNVEYIKLPLMFVYNHESSANVTMIYKIGPQLGILSNASLTDKNGKSIVNDQKSAYQKTVFGAMASAGIGINLMLNMFLDLALRYDYDFTNAEKTNYQNNINLPDHGTTGTSAGRATTHNMNVGINVGLRWLLRDNNM